MYVCISVFDSLNGNAPLYLSLPILLNTHSELIIKIIMITIPNNGMTIKLVKNKSPSLKKSGSRGVVVVDDD